MKANPISYDLLVHMDIIEGKPPALVPSLLASPLDLWGSAHPSSTYMVFHLNGCHVILQGNDWLATVSPGNIR